MKPLTQFEISGVAAEIALNIKSYLDERWYDKSGITLRISWSSADEIGAWASVAPTMEAPTEHKITLTDKLVESIYSEALDFAIFAQSRKGQLHPSGMHLIPEQFEMFEAAELMFRSGIAFVIFHELGHINQYHGPIRAKYDPASTDPRIISEFAAVNATDPPTGNFASIYHATELAADFEALDWMAIGLEAMFKGDELNDHVYLQCAIVSCIMLLFNGDNPVRIEPVPVGSHPYPLARMDFWVKIYAERILLLSDTLEINAASGEGITKRLMDASFWAIMKWMTRPQLLETSQYADFVKGAAAQPHYDGYMREVINMWTQEYQQARCNRKYGMPFSVLYFTDEFRAKVGATMNHESYEDHVRHGLASLQQE